MKRRALWVTIAAVTLITLACGLGGGGNTGGADGGGRGNPSADWPWDDVPLYTAADSASMTDWEDLGTEMKFENVEGRYFETPDTTQQVLDFYKAQMPRHGWTGGENAELVNDFSSVRWSKQGGDTLALITISTDPDGNVRVMAVRAEGEKQ